jgi:hypothetical protein
MVQRNRCYPIDLGATADERRRQPRMVNNIMDHALELGDTGAKLMTT